MWGLTPPFVLFETRADDWRAPMRCPACQRENSPDHRFCAGCGAPLAQACAACGREARPDDAFCGGCGARLDRDEASRSSAERAGERAERRQLTVLFCDLVDSTRLSAALDAEDWRELVRRYQEAVAGAIERFEGYVAQYLGDGILAYFGWPRAHEDDAERALRAGIAIAEVVELAVRVGIHTGPVVIGEMGSGVTRETLAMGETTNVAARLQALADPGAVVFSAATLRLVQGLFVAEDLGAQPLKGIESPVRAYRAVRPSGLRSRLDLAGATSLTPLVGREQEIGLLLDRWEQVRKGAGQTVLVLGEAGIGKSRLVYELRERLARLPHTWLESFATPYTERTPFHPVAHLLAQGLGIAAQDTPEAKLAKLAGGLRGASPEAASLLADFLGLAPSTSLPMNPDLRRRRTMELLTEWHLDLSAAQPLVVLVEDLQWCDASTLELLGHLIEQGARGRVLLLATARPEFTPPWPARPSLTTLQLGRLSDPQVREMVASLGGLELSTGTRDTLVVRADGNPLYVEELAKAVIEPDVGRGAIPATLADSLMGRLDRLSSAKQVAQRAAVLGREFSYRLLAAAAGLEEGALREGLARLVEAGIVFARGEPPQSTYTFKHVLVQEAAYDSLLRRRRQQIHGRVFSALVEEFPERAAAEPEVVARHAELAGRIDDAIVGYQRAGEHARARSAHAEAIHHSRRALALLVMQPEGEERDAREVALQLALAGSLVAALGFGHPDCEAAYERARSLCETLGDTGGLGLALIGLCLFHSTRGELERGRALAVGLLSANERSGDKDLALHGHCQIAIAEHFLGRFASSLAHCEAAQKLYELERHHPTVSALAGDAGVVALIYAGWNLWHLGWPDRALARVREGVVLARRLSDPFNLGHALAFEMVLHWLRRDGRAQRERALETIAISEAHGFPLWLALGRTFGAAARVAGGEHGALADLLAGLALAAERPNQAGAPALFAVLGETNLAVGRPAEARGAVEAGHVFAGTGQLFFEAELHRLEGEIVLAGGGEPEAAFQRALDIARKLGARSFELRAATSFARRWRDQGKAAQARELLQPLYNWFTEGFDTKDLRDAKALLAELGR
jgi:class 3 adenylate cyclase